MNLRVLRWALVVALCATMLPLSTVNAFATRSIDGEFPVSLAEYGQVQPAIDYPYVVYKSESAQDGPYTDIWGYNLETGLTFPICTVYGEQANPSIYGTKVVYSDDRVTPDDGGGCNIYMYDIETGEESVVASNPVDEGNPFIYGDRVVFNSWSENPTSLDTHMVDLTTGVETTIVAAPGHQEEPSIWEDIVCWHDQRNGDDVRIYDLTAEQEIALTDAAGEPFSTYYYDPMAGDGKVVWEKYYYNGSEWRYEIQMYDIETEQISTISSSLTSSRWHPEVNDGWVVWQDRRNTNGNVAEVWGYNIESKEETCLVAAEYDADTSTWVKYAGRAATGGNWIAYHDHRDEGTGTQNWEDLYVKYIGPDDVVPTQQMPLEGPTRYETAVEVSQQSFPLGSESVVIATGENWPDALAGASFAGAVSAPILLVGDMVADRYAEELPGAVAAEIERLGASSAYILGGEEAIDPVVQGDIESIVGTDAVRFAGEDRWETACIVASETVGIMGDAWDGTAFATTGLNWPDALAAAPLSAYAGYPVFLAGPDGMSAETEACMDDLGVTGTIVLGGTVAMPLGVSAQLKALAIDEIDRVGGDTRYETAALIAEYGVGELGMSFDTLGVATGTKFPDALSAGAALGQEGHTLMLTPGTYLHPATAAAIEANAADISQIRYAGGPSAVNQDVRDAITGYLY